MLVEFEKAWSDLNARLREREAAAGLHAALHELEAHQRESGFITDALQALERHTLAHPRDPSRCFRVQYNPRRALRFRGSSPCAPRPSAPLHDGCLLCRENIAWQQRGIQLGYQVDAGPRTYFALMNPFPLLPAHVVFAAREHRPQRWGFSRDDGADVGDLVADLVTLAGRMPGHVGFYNGVDAGASIPGHLHFQFMMRPEDGGAFPLELIEFEGDPRTEGPAHATRYPLDVALWKGRTENVIGRAVEWIRRWGERNRARLPGLSGNLVATREMDDDEVALYFVPRDRSRARGDGFSGLTGGLEVLGELVLSSPEEKARLDAGLIDYACVESALASVRTPMEVD